MASTEIPVGRGRFVGKERVVNISQQTSLSITLREFEARLARLRVLLEQYESITRLTPESVERLHQMIVHQQAVSDDLFRRFQLKRETIDVVQS
jgi:hypothetical protein